ncbi:UNKNOWN [Stylonychia lemnae]|uniref:Uncharacterized protein n=1 Tax=Stylonychia lemnae TaxID=5949 RepID=A0A078AGN2_STYLE|nr:UNKNOWN [Stylonychia lemnae]|eukprot:CDW80692.1 UNKNOWN [Stylonychia lemnae]
MFQQKDSQETLLHQTSRSRTKLGLASFLIIGSAVGLVMIFNSVNYSSDILVAQSEQTQLQTSTLRGKDAHVAFYQSCYTRADQESNSNWRKWRNIMDECLSEQYCLPGSRFTADDGQVWQKYNFENFAYNRCYGPADALTEAKQGWGTEMWNQYVLDCNSAMCKLQPPTYRWKLTDYLAKNQECKASADKSFIYSRPDLYYASINLCLGKLYCNKDETYNLPIWTFDQWDKASNECNTLAISWYNSGDSTWSNKMSQCHQQKCAKISTGTYLKANPNPDYPEGSWIFMGKYGVDAQDRAFQRCWNECPNIMLAEKRATNGRDWFCARHIDAKTFTEGYFLALQSSTEQELEYLPQNETITSLVTVDGAADAVGASIDAIMKLGKAFVLAFNPVMCYYKRDGSQIPTLLQQYIRPNKIVWRLNEDSYKCRLDGDCYNGCLNYGLLRYQCFIEGKKPNGRCACW